MKLTKTFIYFTFFLFSYNKNEFELLISLPRANNTNTNTKRPILSLINAIIIITGEGEQFAAANLANCNVSTMLS